MKTPRKKKTQAKRTRRPSPIPPPQVKGLAAWAPELGQTPDGQGPTTAVMVPLDLIDVPSHVQELPLDVENVKGIAATVAVSGLINPITLRQVGDRYELQAGRHRLEAHKQLGLGKVLAHIQPDATESTAAVVRSVENLQRRTLRPYEEARGYQDLVAKGVPVAQVAELCAVREATVKARLRLAALPVEIGVRIGEPAFPLAHAETLLPLAEHPKLLEAAKAAIGMLDFDKRPLTTHAFREAVRAELRKKRLVKDLETWQVKELSRRYPDFERAVKRLPKIKLGGGHEGSVDCIDPKAYMHVVKPFREKEKARQAEEAAKEAKRAKKEGRASSEEDWREQQRRREFDEAYLEHEHGLRIVKAAKGSLGLDDRLLRLVAVDAFHALVRYDADRTASLLAEATGASASDLAQALGCDADQEGVNLREAFVDRLLANGDRLPLARFLTVATLLRAEGRWGNDWSGIAVDWLGIEAKPFLKARDAAYKAWVKAGATSPLPGQEGDAETTSETGGLTVEPESVAAES